MSDCSVAVCRPDIGLEVGHGRAAINAVIEIDDVSSAAAGSHASSRCGSHLCGSPLLKNLLIDVALKRQPRIVAPGRGQVVTDAQADHIRAALCQQIKVRTLL